jgi:preprotein translocase SecE subunit
MTRGLASVFSAVVQYFQGSYREFKTVTWPTREAIVRYTILVTVTIVIGVAILTAFDYGLQQLTNRFLIH